MRYGIIAIVSLAFALATGTAEARVHHRTWQHRHHAGHHFPKSHRSAAAHGLGGAFNGLRPEFRAKISQIYAAMPADTGKFSIGSGCRSHSEQAHLHAIKPHLAAAPGHSNHERCLAADLVASSAALRWLHQHVAQYGLAFPISYENWHLQPAGLTRIASRRSHARYVLLHDKRFHTVSLYAPRYVRAEAEYQDHREGVW